MVSPNSGRSLVEGHSSTAVLSQLDPDGHRRVTGEGEHDGFSPVR